MTRQQLFQAIFKRKSIRRFSLVPLTAAELAGVREFACQATPLHPAIRFAITELQAPDIVNLLPVRAPHYLCLYSEPAGQALLNAGFLLQQIDLYLSAAGLGSCWLGVAKPSRHVPPRHDGLEFVIMLAFGRADPAIPLHREQAGEFVRKRLPEITDIEGADWLLEPVRLAPSASNSQPWFFSGSLQTITVSRRRLHLIQAALYDRLNQIDTGIALCHLWLTLGQRGLAMQVSYDHRPTADHYEFVAAISVTPGTS
jgi:hypothetical protein